MSYYTYPRTKNYDSDLGFLIKSYEDIKLKIDELLEKIGDKELATMDDVTEALQPILADIERIEAAIPTKVSELQNDSNYLVGPINRFNLSDLHDDLNVVTADQEWLNITFEYGEHTDDPDNNILYFVLEDEV